MGPVYKIFQSFQLYIVILFIAIFIPSISHALSTGGVGGYPAYPDPSIQYSESWFIYNLDAGESKEDAIILFNTTDETHTIKLYAVDSIPNNLGNFALKAEDSSQEGIGAWIELSENIITLQPAESREIPFTITLPEVVDVGEHSGGLIIQKVRAGTVEAETGASIVTRVGIRIYETVPGDIIKDVQLVDFVVQRNTPENKKPFYDIRLTVLNKSNVSLSPKADLQIRGWGKSVYFRYSKFNDGIIIDLRDVTDFFKDQDISKEWRLLRDQKVITSWEWPEPVFGRFTFQVELTYEGDQGPKKLITPAITIWVIPWLEVLVIGGLILLIILLIVVKKIFFGKRKWQSYVVKQGDNLPQIAYRSKVSLKRIAKLNQIKQPYIIKPGQKILAPPIFQKTQFKETKIKSSSPINPISTNKKKKNKQNFP